MDDGHWYPRRFLDGIFGIFGRKPRQNSNEPQFNQASELYDALLHNGSNAHLRPIRVVAEPVTVDKDTLQQQKIEREVLEIKEELQDLQNELGKIGELDFEKSELANDVREIFSNEVHLEEQIQMVLDQFARIQQDNVQTVIHAENVPVGTSDKCTETEHRERTAIDQDAKQAITLQPPSPLAAQKATEKCADSSEPPKQPENVPAPECASNPFHFEAKSEAFASQTSTRDALQASTRASPLSSIRNIDACPPSPEAPTVQHNNEPQQVGFKPTGAGTDPFLNGFRTQEYGPKFSFSKGLHSATPAVQARRPVSINFDDEYAGKKGLRNRR